MKREFHSENFKYIVDWVMVRGVGSIRLNENMQANWQISNDSDEAKRMKRMSEGKIL